MALVVSASKAYSGETNFANSLSLTFDAGSAGAGRVLLVFFRGANFPSSASFDGVSLQSRGDASNIRVYSLAAPATGAKTLFFGFFSANFYQYGIFAVVLSGAHETSPFGELASAATTGTSITTPSVTISDGDLLVGAGFTANMSSDVWSVTAPATILDKVPVINFGFAAAGAQRASTGQIQWNAGASAAMRAAVIRIIAAAAGASSLPPGRRPKITNLFRL